MNDKIIMACAAAAGALLMSGTAAAIIKKNIDNGIEKDAQDKDVRKLLAKSGKSKDWMDNLQEILK